MKEDVIPIYFRKEDIKRKRGTRMCKFFAYHMRCRMEEKYGECEYLHEDSIRAVHDIICLNQENDKQITVREI